MYCKQHSKVFKGFSHRKLLRFSKELENSHFYFILELSINPCHYTGISSRVKGDQICNFLLDGVIDEDWCEIIVDPGGCW